MTRLANIEKAAREAVEWERGFTTSASTVLKMVEIMRAMSDSLNDIATVTGSYAGCECDVTDCGPGDCWPCRMQILGSKTDEALQMFKEFEGE